MAPFPFAEKPLYAFVNEIGQACSPTFPRSFLCSVAFAGHVMGAESALAVLESKRLTGAAAKFFKEKRKLVQKSPLTVAQVKILEGIVSNRSKRKLPDRVAAGFFLWLITARARFSDGQNSGVLTLDTCETRDGVNGYVEANVARTKSSMTLERKTRFLPMAGGHPEVENVFISQIVVLLTVPTKQSLLSGGVATVGRHLGDDPSHWGTF